MKKLKLPKKITLKMKDILKFGGIALVAIVFVSLALVLMDSSFGSVTSFGMAKQQGISAVGMGSPVYDKAESEVGLSVRNVASFPAPVPPGGTVTGDDAEEYEVTDYSATIETRHLEETCGQISALKSRDDVIFESAGEYERGCNYTFKVRRESTPEILAVIERLDPRELSENTYTIKKLVEDYTSETDILKKKLDSINETLSSAIAAYDDIAKLAANTRDAESLARIIDSKISIIEKLTQQRIDISAQLQRLERAKSEQIDRLDYTRFYVYVSENKFIDWQNVKDSWENAVKLFVLDINAFIQGLTVNLVALILLAVQYAVYLFIFLAAILAIAKYGQVAVKKFWKK